MHNLSVGHAMRPPAAGISSRKTKRTRKPDQDVKMRTTGLVSLADPNKTTDSTTALKPLAHAVTESRNVTNRIDLRRPISQGQEQTTKPHTTTQGIDLKTVRGTEHRATHAAQARAHRVKAQPNTTMINRADVRPTC